MAGPRDGSPTQLHDTTNSSTSDTDSEHTTSSPPQAHPRNRKRNSCGGPMPSPPRPPYYTPLIQPDTLLPRSTPPSPNPRLQPLTRTSSSPGAPPSGQAFTICDDDDAVVVLAEGGMVDYSKGARKIRCEERDFMR
ncbi:MAG: hypothetical protein M1827_005604 [Pycnora praestabilis]|nr:MAG: hypothetical protein M1827_005604 [Pycnora praestabilis]